MIFSSFVYLGSFLIGALLLILPSGTGFPPEVTTAITEMGSYVVLLDTLLPVATLGIVLAILFSVELAIFGFKALRWMVSFLPFIGGRG